MSIIPTENDAEFKNEAIQIKNVKSIVFGNIILLESDWRIIFKCQICHIVFKKLRKFLNHSLQHYFKLSETDVEILIKNIEQNEDDNNIDDSEGHSDDNSLDIKIDEDIFYNKNINSNDDYASHTDSDDNYSNTEAAEDEYHKFKEYSSELEELELNEIEQNEVMKTMIDNQTNTTFEIELLDVQRCQMPINKAKKSYKKRKTKIINSNELRCEVCKKRYYSLKSFNSHIKRHTESYACDMCDAVFNDACNLKEHRNRHLGNKPHECEICGKTFTTTTELKVHTRVHTGEKPYVCDQCGASYKTSSHLTLHRRKHSNIRPHQCDTCDKAFFKKYDLKVHLRIHTNERPYECADCGQNFGRYDSLKQHKKLHLPDKKYKCDYCNKSFAQNAGLYAHLKNQHALLKLV